MLTLVKFLRKDYLFIIEIVVLFIISLTPLLWFTPQHMVLGLDSGYPIDFIARLHQRLFTWFSPYNFGMDMTPSMGQISLFALLAFVRYLGVSMYSVQHVTFVFWFFAISFSMYLFVRHLYPDRKFWLIRLIAVFVYVYNFHLLSFWVQGEQPTFSAYVVLPLLSLILIKFFRKEISTFTAGFFLNIVFFIFNAGGIIGVPLLGSSIIIAVSISLFYFLILVKQENWALIKRFIFLLLYVFILFVCFNAYFIMPFINSFNHQFSSQVGEGSRGIASAVGWTQYISTYDSYINLFRLQGDNSWYGNPYLYSQVYLHSPTLVLASFIFPILAYATIFLVKNRKERVIVILFVFLSLVAVFFSAGAHPPLGFIYLFMIKHIPGFVAFRSPYYKFIISLYFTFAVLIGISSYYLLNKLKHTFKIIISFLFICFILVYSYPFFQKATFYYDLPLTTMVHIPQYVLDFYKFQDDLHNDYRILVAPPNSTISQIKAYKWGYISASSLFIPIGKKSFVYNDSNLPYDENYLVLEMYNMLKNSDYSSFLHLANVAHIGYILVTDDVASDYKASLTEKPIIYNRLLQDNSLFKRVWNEGQWTLYLINGVNSSKISAFNSVASVISLDSKNSILLDFIHNQFVIKTEGSNSSVIDSVLQPSISEIINPYICTSCVIVDSGSIQDISLSPSSILPGSILYGLKIYKENRELAKIKNKEALLDMYLGLSLKRVNEIDLSINSRDSSLSLYDWFQPIKSLQNYWSIMFNLTQNNYIKENDFTSLYKIYQYSKFEERQLGSDYNNLFTSNQSLKMELSNALSTIKKTNILVRSVIKDYQSGNIFVYNIDDGSVKNRPRNIYIPESSLEKTVNGSYMLPYQYSLDEKMFNVAYQTKNNLLQIDDVKATAKTLKLYFKHSKLDNLIPVTQNVSIFFPYGSKNCISSEIKNYNWADKYIVEGKISQSVEDPTIYLKRDYRVFNTAHTIANISSYFSPDVEFLIKYGLDGSFAYQFSGEPNDINAHIYFCVSGGQDPNAVYAQLQVRQIFMPVVYEEFKTAKSINYNIANKLPILSYKKIDPTRYIISVRGATSPYILSFSEQYSNLWHIKNLDGTFDSNDYSKNHFILDGYANGWYITKKGDYDLVVYFTSQDLFNKGIVISFLSLSIVGFLLIGKKYIRWRA